MLHPSAAGRATSLLRRFVAALALTLAALLATATSASARVGDVRSIPSFHGPGVVAMTGTFSGWVHWDYQSGPYCVYVQYKHVAVAGVDGTWNRLTSDSCGPAYAANWSRPTNRAFNGMKFRICQDKPNDFDPCGGDVTIYV